MDLIYAQHRRVPEDVVGRSARRNGSSGSDRLPLQGVRVVDMSTSYAGPTATMYLADLGADVIKVERPGGDDTRGWGPPFVGADAAWFASANRNKRSIALDIRSLEGAKILRRLIGGSQVFVQNVNPAKLSGLGVDPQTLCAAQPDLVYCAVSGFGLTGRDSHLAGYDLIAQARSGMMSVTGPLGGVPQRMSAPLSDVVTGLAAALAIVAALRRVDAGGGGGVVDISLLESDLAIMAPRISSYLAGEAEPAPCGATDSVLAIYQQFETADRPVVIAVGSDAIWLRLCAVLGLPRLAADDRLTTNAGRRKHRADVIGRIAEAVRRRPSHEWLSAFAAAQIPAAPIAFLSDVVRDGHIAERGSIFSLPVPDGGAGGESVHVVGAPFRISGAEAPRRPAPALGADFVEILGQLGLGPQQIRRLVDHGAVVAPRRGDDSPAVVAPAVGSS